MQIMSKVTIPPILPMDETIFLILSNFWRKILLELPKSTSLHFVLLCVFITRIWSLNQFLWVYLNHKAGKTKKLRNWEPGLKECHLHLTVCCLSDIRVMPEIETKTKQIFCSQHQHLFYVSVEVICIQRINCLIACLSKAQIGRTSTWTLFT